VDDPDPRGRAAAVMALAELDDEPPSDLVERVILLTEDADAEVRDAACFVLGTQWDQLDSSALRDALAARLDDPHTDARCEALLGLARRGDPAALAEAVRRLTDPAGPGDDLFAGVAELYRRQSRGEADDDAPGWWRLMDRMLAIAPRRGRELFDGTERHLATDPAARRWLREHSALVTAVADA